MELIITDKLIIQDIEEVSGRISYLSGQNIDVERMKDFILTENSTIFYFDNKMNGKSEDDPGVMYVWLDSGYITKTGGHPIFISLLKINDYYSGHFVGNAKVLSGTIIDYYPQNARSITANLSRFPLKYEKKINKRILKHIPIDKIKENKQESENDGTDQEMTSGARQLESDNMIASDGILGSKPEVKEKPITIPKVRTEITEEIYDQLLFNSFKTIDGLDRYLKIIGSRLLRLIEQGKKEYYVLNKIKSAIVNTGLMDLFGRDVLVMYRLNLTYNIYTAYKVITGKSEYMSNDFTREQSNINLRPISFFDEGEDIFNPSMYEIDINYRNLVHIIEERRDRFPDDIQTMSLNAIATKINNALELGIKMQYRDKSYAKAIYSAKTSTISWLMPLHIITEFHEEPELVLVIRKANDFYEIKTILQYDDELKDRITALSLYSKLW